MARDEIQRDITHTCDIFDVAINYQVCSKYFKSGPEHREWIFVAICQKRVLSPRVLTFEHHNCRSSNDPNFVLQEGRKLTAVAVLASSPFFTQVQYVQ
jgi:hypothetical protein